MVSGIKIIFRTQACAVDTYIVFIHLAVLLRFQKSHNNERKQKDKEFKYQRRYLVC